MPTITTEAEALDALKELRQALAMAATLNEVVQVRRQAQRVQRLIQSARLGMALQTQAVRIQLRAERQAGLLLGRLVRHGGDRKSSDHADRWTRASLGVTSRQSAEWQRVGRLPRDEFLAYVRRFSREGELLSSAGLVRWAKMCEEASKVPGEFESELLGRVPEQLQGLVRQGQRFACIYVNPPWRLAASRPTAIRGFAKALARLPVAAVAAQSAHLHVRATNESLEESLELIRGWGFRWNRLFTRTDVASMVGDRWQESRDVLLSAVCGRVPPGDGDSFLRSDGDEISPADSCDGLQSLIAATSPGPYLSLFDHVGSPCWTAIAS